MDHKSHLIEVELSFILLVLPAVFAMEINVTKNLLTGESTVLSAASVPTEDLNRHTGLKVFDDGRKCVYALNPAEVPNTDVHLPASTRSLRVSS